jgi:hypothetical protein
MPNEPHDQPTTVAPAAGAAPPAGAVPPVDPRRPVAPPARAAVREPVVPAAAAGDPSWLGRIEDRLGSLTGAVVVLAIVSLAALGLSIYALTQSDDSGSGASPARVSRLSDRVSRLEGQSANAADTDTTSSLASRLDDKADSSDVSRLREELGQLRSAVQRSSGGSQSSAQALSDLGDRLAKLEQQVEDLASSQGGTP